MTEANARIVIDKLLRESDWILPGDDGVVNVDTEMQNQSGFADYVLKDENDFPICIIEAKKELRSPLVGKDAGQTIMHTHIHLIPRRTNDVKKPKGGVRGVIPEKQAY